jgi:hypothetical protein
LTRLWQYLMAQAGSPANLLKKNLVSRCVNLIAMDQARALSNSLSPNDAEDGAVMG